MYTKLINLDMALTEPYQSFQRYFFNLLLS